MRGLSQIVIALLLAAPALAQDPIRIEGAEQSRLNGKLPDGGLSPAVGVRNFQVFRASRTAPEITDGKGFTYNHHVDMACWDRRRAIRHRPMDQIPNQRRRGER
ncbi:MAG: hypothetical protein ABSB42_11315 [Tepidisphaeraceae bacterium]